MSNTTNVIQNAEIQSRQGVNNAMMEMKYNMMAALNVCFLVINIVLSANKEAVNLAILDIR